MLAHKRERLHDVVRPPPEAEAMRAAAYKQGFQASQAAHALRMELFVRSIYVS